MRILLALAVASACGSSTIELERRVARLESQLAARSSLDAPDLESRLGRAGIIATGDEVDAVEGRKRGEVVARWWCIGGVGDCHRTQAACEAVRQRRIAEAPADSRRHAGGEPCERRRVAFCVEVGRCVGYLRECQALAGHYGERRPEVCVGVE